MPDRKRVTERLMESHYLKSPLHGVGILANGSRSPEACAIGQMPVGQRLAPP